MTTTAASGSSGKPTEKNNYELAHELYEALPTDIKSFVKTRKLEGQYKIKQWLNWFQQVSQMDKLRDTARPGKTSPLMIAGIIAAIVGLFGGIFYWPLYFILLAGVAVIIVVAIKNKKPPLPPDVDNRFREFVVPLLVILREEVDDNSKTKIRLDLNKPIQEAYVVKTEAPASMALPRRETKFYEISWLSANLTLTDSTQVSFEMKEHIRQRKTSKRSSSGKLKTKSKVKTKHLLMLTVSFDAKRYQPVSEEKSIGTYSPKGDTHTYKLKRLVDIPSDKPKSPSLAAFTGSWYNRQTPPVDSILAAIAGVYQNVKPI